MAVQRVPTMYALGDKIRINVFLINLIKFSMFASEKRIYINCMDKFS